MFLERSINQADNIGWIEVICGSMFSGKTEELIRRVKRAKLAKQKVKIFKPKQDTRYSKKKVTSHDNNSIKSKQLSNWLGLLQVEFLYSQGNIEEANKLLKQLPNNPGKKYVSAKYLFSKGSYKEASDVLNSIIKSSTFNDVYLSYFTRGVFR